MCTCISYHIDSSIRSIYINRKNRCRTSVTIAFSCSQVQHFYSFSIRLIQATMAVSPNVVVDNDLVAAICPYLVTKPKEWIVTGRANYTFKIPPSYYVSRFNSFLPFLQGNKNEKNAPASSKIRFGLKISFYCKMYLYASNLQPDGTTEESIFESFSYLKDKNRTVVPIKYLDPPANMQDFLVVSKDETFSIFISHHVKCANTLRDTLIGK